MWNQTKLTLICSLSLVTLFFVVKVMFIFVESWGLFPYTHVQPLVSFILLHKKNGFALSSPGLGCEDTLCSHTA